MILDPMVVSLFFILQLLRHNTNLNERLFIFNMWFKNKLRRFFLVLHCWATLKRFSNNIDVVVPYLNGQVDCIHSSPMSYFQRLSIHRIFFFLFDPKRSCSNLFCLYFFLSHLPHFCQSSSVLYCTLLICPLVS